MDSSAGSDRPSEIQNAGNSAQLSNRRRESLASQDSQTAKEFIESQLQLEADAREVLPYSFDSCTQALGPLRQTLFSCLTCNPPPANDEDPYTPAAVCYSCSISCHGEHTLVELFSKRNFVCDCGTSRFPDTSICTLRVDPQTKSKGVHSQPPAEANNYNHNFRNRFCACSEEYDAHKEKGTMFQCLGLGTVETGGCGEDWWHPECLVGLPRGWQSTAKVKEAAPKTGEESEGTDDKPVEQDGYEETPLPPGFPGEDDFETFICYKCLDSNPWLKRYAGTKGFLSPVYKNQSSDKIGAKKASNEAPPQDPTQSRKRKADDDEDDQNHGPKKTRLDSQDALETIQEEDSTETAKHKHESLPSKSISGTFSLFVKEDFRDHLCRCPDCFPNLVPHPQLREEEETYEPPLSEDGDEANGAGSQGSRSLLDRGEAALSNIDRVRAIEGAMVYNHLRDKVKAFLKPFAESGQAVSAEDIKSYFERLRGDDMAIREAGGQASTFSNNGAGGQDGDHDGSGNNRKEQSGY